MTHGQGIFISLLASSGVGVRGTRERDSSPSLSLLIHLSLYLHENWVILVVISLFQSTSCLSLLFVIHYRSYFNFHSQIRIYSRFENICLLFNRVLLTASKMFTHSLSENLKFFSSPLNLRSFGIYFSYMVKCASRFISSFQ